MKNFKNLLIMLPVMLVVLFTSCKKGSDNPGPDGGTDAQITAKDLLDYYIVTERKAGNKLGVLYFTQDGATIKGNLHGKGYLRANDVTVVGSTLKFDVNSDGKFVYTFAFEKGGDGKIKLKSYQYTDSGDPSQNLNFAVMAGKATALPFEGATFKTGELVLNFTNTNNVATMNWDIKSRQIGTQFVPPNQVIPIYGVAPEVSSPYYSLLGLGWKSNNDEFMGACVPNWKDVATPIMLVERAGVVYPCTKQ